MTSIKQFCANDVWSECGSTTDREKTLINQPRGVELEYRVCGLNSAGTGGPSNTVAMVL